MSAGQSVEDLKNQIRGAFIKIGGTVEDIAVISRFLGTCTNNGRMIDLCVATQRFHKEVTAFLDDEFPTWKADIPTEVRNEDYGEYISD